MELSVTDHLKGLQKHINGTNAVIRGVATQVKKAASGHTYFDLKDDDSIIKCVIFRDSNTQAPLSDSEVRVNGQSDIYRPRGQLQVNVSACAQLDASSEALRAKNLLIGHYAVHKRPPRSRPTMPKHVVVITSKTSAACADMLSERTVRWENVKMTIVHSSTQGDLAIHQLVNAISLAKTLGPDVLILARGGGSQDDLKAFDSKEVCDAVLETNCFTISAIGHETDHPVLDCVADSRAKTPTAAMGIVPIELELRGRLLKSKRNVTTTRNAVLASRKKSIEKHRITVHKTAQLKERIEKLKLNSVSEKKRFASHRHRLDVANDRVTHGKAVKMQDYMRKVADVRARLPNALSMLARHRYNLTKSRERIKDVETEAFHRKRARLNASAGVSTLEMGFCVAFDTDENRVCTAMETGQKMKIQFADETTTWVVVQ